MEQVGLATRDFRFLVGLSLEFPAPGCLTRGVFFRVGDLVTQAVAVS